MLLQAFYGIRCEPQLMERIEFDLLFPWFVGLGVDEPAWDPLRAPPRTGIGCWTVRSPQSFCARWMAAKAEGSRRMGRKDESPFTSSDAR